MHIDQHADLLNNRSIKDYECLKEDKVSFRDYLTLSKPLPGGKSYPVFRWDNYIVPIMKLFPNWFEESFFATLNGLGSRERQTIGFRPYVHQNQLTLASQIETEFTNSNLDWEEVALNVAKEWIVNLDIDYFFSEGRQKLSDDYILELSERLNRFKNRIKVMTVAFSPECCGKWEAAEHAFEVFCQGFPEFAGFILERKQILG